MSDSKERKRQMKQEIEGILDKNPSAKLTSDQTEFLTRNPGLLEKKYYNKRDPVQQPTKQVVTTPVNPPLTSMEQVPSPTTQPPPQFTSSPSGISTQPTNEWADYVNELSSLDIEDIGTGRLGALELKEVIKNSFSKLKGKWGKDAALILKTFGIKFCIHGTRMSDDNFCDFIINGTSERITAKMLLEVMGMRNSGIKTAATEITPTRIARFFAEEASRYISVKSYSPPFYLQANIRVNDLPQEYHFLAAMYIPEVRTTYQNSFLLLCSNFDDVLISSGRLKDVTNGFFVRCYVVFKGLSDLEKIKSSYASIKKDKKKLDKDIVTNLRTLLGVPKLAKAKKEESDEEEEDEG